MPTVTVERSYPAAPEVVWRSWADVDRLTRWWGCAVDMLWNVHDWEFRVGGAIRVSLDFDGEPYEVNGRFVEIESPHRLAFDWEHGQRITVTIAADETGSTMTVEHEGLGDEEGRQIVNGGWSASVEQLAAALP